MLYNVKVSGEVSEDVPSVGVLAAPARRQGFVNNRWVNGQFVNNKWVKAVPFVNSWVGGTRWVGAKIINPSEGNPFYQVTASRDRRTCVYNALEVKKLWNN